MVIRDWRSGVCSSDLAFEFAQPGGRTRQAGGGDDALLELVIDRDEIADGLLDHVERAARADVDGLARGRLLERQRHARNDVVDDVARAAEGDAVDREFGIRGALTLGQSAANAELDRKSTRLNSSH